MTAAPPSTAPLTEDEIDELVYLARTADKAALTAEISSLTSRHSLSSPIQVLQLAIEAASGNTLLHYPAANASIEILTYLLTLLPPSPSGTPSQEAASVLNAQNSAGNTPLHWAALNGHLEVVKMLLERGADPGVRNQAGRDVIVEAEMSGKEDGVKVAEWLLGTWEGVETGVGAGADEGELVAEEGAKVNGESSAKS